MKKRILVVDDSPYMRAVLEELLKKNGYKVFTAKNGLDGVSLFKELYDMDETPDVTLMDISMKRMDGLTALKKIKTIDNEAIVIMCSAVTQRHAMVEAIQSGAARFITKPFQDEDVLKVIKKELSKRSK